MKHSNFKPLPNGLLEHFRNVESASFMGLLPEINRAWLTIDNKLFLWDLGETDQYTVYDGIDDIIVSVALAVPKANMFISTIKYFLVVATTVEVLLLALSWDDDYIEGHQLQNGLVHGGGSRSNNESIPTSPAFSASKKKSELRVLPTKYIIPTDNVTVIKVMGSTNGRIFMAGVDGNVHEVCYDYTEDVGALAWGARLLHDYIEGVEEDEDFDTDGASKKRRRSNMKGTYKCQKVVHNTYKFQMVNLLLPDFVKDYIGLNDCLSDAVLDDVRHVLYAITVKGKIHVFHLGLDGLAMELVVTDYHIMTELVKYLRYNSSRGDIMPNAEQVRDGYDSGLIEIVSFHVVPITESKNVHGVVVLSNGIRVYISLRDGYNDSYFSTNYTTPPSRLEILHIRNPPPSEVLSTLKFSDTGGKNLSYGVGKNGLDNIKQNINYRDDGVLPKYTPHDSLKLHASYYCHGLFLGAHSDDKQEVGDDVLYSMNEDLVTRNHANPLLNTEASADTLSQQPGLRETVCVVQPSGQGVSARTHSMGGKVYDIKEVCNDLYNYDASMLHTMVVCSKTPPATSVALKPVGGGIPTSSGPSGTANGTAAPSCTSNMEAYSGPSASVVPPLGRSKYTGLDMKSTRTQPISSSNISSGTGIPNIAKLSELVTQSVVSLPPVTLQRQIYCLTNNGLHTIIKLRPIDYMLEILSTASTNETYLEQMHSFFRCYGSVQSSVMCLSIACNTPFECGSNATVRMKAITAIQRLTDGPSYTVVSNTSNNASDTLFDSRFSNTTSGTVLSKKFCYSAMHNALQVFTSRILRPIWLKTIVVENKISPLFKIEIITSIKETLMALLSILTEYYHSVVTAHELSLNIEVLRDTDDRNYLSSHARMVEDASIYRLCRVISRSIHALNLLEVISVSICIDLNLPLDFIADQVWARLAGIDFYTFVVSMDVHSLVKDIIRSICDRAVFLKNDVHICDLFVNKLTTYCYSYFCESDRLEYETTKALSKLENLPRESHEIKYYLDQSISLLLQQCAYWDSVDCVSAHNRSEHNLSENCKKLRVYGSKIQVSHAQDASLDLDMHRTPKTGSALYYYEKVVNTIVDICLITANYFGGGIIPNSDTHYSMSRMNVPLSNSNALTNGSSSNASSFEEYERMLYRGGGLIVVDSNMGVSDTAINRAREECYSTLWSNVMAIKAAPSSGIGSGTVANKSDAAVVEEAMRDPAIAYRLVVAMVTRALNSSDDITLHNLIYSNLYGEGEKDLLMRLEANVYMDDYLRQVDPLLLYKNYEYHGRFSDAADLMISLATTASDSADQGDLPNISERVQYLTYAVRSGTNAVTMTGQDTSSISSNFTVDHVTNMQDQLTVASKLNLKLHLVVWSIILSCLILY